MLWNLSWHLYWLSLSNQDSSIQETGWFSSTNFPQPNRKENAQTVNNEKRFPSRPPPVSLEKKHSLSFFHPLDLTWNLQGDVQPSYLDEPNEPGWTGAKPLRVAPGSSGDVPDPPSSGTPAPQREGPHGATPQVSVWTGGIPGTFRWFHQMDSEGFHGFHWIYYTYNHINNVFMRF